MFNKKQHKLFENISSPKNVWTGKTVILAAGIIAAGWTNDNKVFLLSSDGYSISNPLTGENEIMNHDVGDMAMNNFSKDNLEFSIDELKQTIKVFGLRGGNGNHLTSDFWSLDSFHPRLGEQIVGLQNLKDRNNNPEYWRNFELIKLERLEYFRLTYGFSPNERHFGIFGSGGAEIFSRE